MPKDSKNTSIKCKVCGNETLKSLINNKESERIKILFDEKKSCLVQILHDRIESEFRKLKSNITRIVLKIYFIWAPLDFTKDTIETIGIKIKHIEEEIEIRVESIKIELDEIHEAFKNELNNFKNELVE